MDANEFMQNARKMAEAGLGTLQRFADGQKPDAYSLHYAWDQLHTAAENLRYAAREFGLDDPRGG